MNKNFINYAHRGASHYCPENTFLSFYTGVYMGANGIETDVQCTKDNVLVLFHDDTLDRVTGERGSIADYTYEELQAFFVKKEGLQDKIVRFEDFLARFRHFDLTFAIELKVGGVEQAVADMIFKYGLENKCIITSFQLDYLKVMRECAPTLRIGYLTSSIEESVVQELLDMGAYEICPKGDTVTKERVTAWHKQGLNVRAWGIANADIMKLVYDAGADGMTVNFPDWLVNYIKKKIKEKENSAIHLRSFPFLVRRLLN